MQRRPDPTRGQLEARRARYRDEEIPGLKNALKRWNQLEAVRSRRERRLADVRERLLPALEELLSSPAPVQTFPVAQASSAPQLSPSAA